MQNNNPANPAEAIPRSFQIVLLIASAICIVSVITFLQTLFNVIRFAHWYHLEVHIMAWNFANGG